MKKYLFSLLCVVCVTVCFMTTASAGNIVPYAVTGGNLYFDTDYEVIRDCDKSVTNAVIPAQIDGVNVTYIGNYAFSSCSTLTEVTIPGSVKSIGEGAFYNSALTEVTIPGNVRSIGDVAFSDCVGLMVATILNGVSEIGDAAFKNCTSLTAVTIPVSMTCIGDETFYGCNHLRYIYYPGTQEQWRTIEIGAVAIRWWVVIRYESPGPERAEISNVSALISAANWWYGVSAEVDCAQRITATVFCAFYDSAGRMTSLNTKALSIGNNRVSFHVHGVEARLFVLDSNLIPLCAGQIVNLPDGVIGIG